VRPRRLVDRRLLRRLHERRRDLPRQARLRRRRLRVRAALGWDRRRDGDRRPRRGGSDQTRSRCGVRALPRALRSRNRLCCRRPERVDRCSRDGRCRDRQRSRRRRQYHLRAAWRARPSTRPARSRC
jgi:hypothetical protein